MVVVFFSFRCLDSKVHPQPSKTLHAHTTVFLHICKHIYMQIVLPFRKVYSDLKDCFGMVHHTLVHLQCACIGVVCYRDSTESWRQRLERCGTGCTQWFHSWTEKCCQVCCCIKSYTHIIKCSILYAGGGGGCFSCTPFCVIEEKLPAVIRKLWGFLL